MRLIGLAVVLALSLTLAPLGAAAQSEPPSQKVMLHRSTMRRAGSEQIACLQNRGKIPALRAAAYP